MNVLRSHNSAYHLGLMALALVFCGWATPVRAAGNLFLTLNVNVSPEGDVSISGYVNNAGGELPADVSISGLWTGTASVNSAGAYSDERTFPPGTNGFVVVTATVDGESVTESRYVFVDGEPGEPGQN